MDYKKIADNTEKDTLSICATVEEIVAAFREVKKGKAELKGKFRLGPTTKAAGASPRAVNLMDAKAMERVFHPFVSGVKQPLDKPFYDERRGALVATDGVSMLFCNIPEGFTKEAAEKDGLFYTMAHGYPDWTLPMGMFDRTISDYTLLGLDKVAEVEKGDRMFNILVTASAAARAYRHMGDNGRWHNLYMWIGGKMYDPDHVAAVATALFRLGCDRVGFYEDGRTQSYARYPLHIVGYGNNINSRGLVMPMRFPSTETGAVEWVNDTVAVNAA